MLRDQHVRKNLSLQRQAVSCLKRSTCWNLNGKSSEKSTKVNWISILEIKTTNLIFKWTSIFGTKITNPFQIRGFRNFNFLWIPLNKVHPLIRL